MDLSMGADRSGSAPQTLRQHLRGATAALHNRLDTAMRPPENWQSREQYALFLSSQYQARGAVEQWLADNAPVDLTPPAQLPLLTKDLQALGADIPHPRFAFALKNEGTSTALGAAWVLAGSSLGNRAMLQEMRRALPAGEDWPAAFLGSTTMTQFWQDLRSRIEAPHADIVDDIAVRAAKQVFHHFLSVAETTRPKSRKEMAQ